MLKFNSPELVASVRAKKPVKQKIGILYGRVGSAKGREVMALVLDGLAIIKRSEISAVDDYGITHVYSGMNVFTVKEFKQAQQVMSALLDLPINWHQSFGDGAATLEERALIAPVKLLAQSSYDKPEKAVNVVGLAAEEGGELSDLLRYWALGGYEIKDKNAAKVYAALRCAGEPVAAGRVSELILGRAEESLRSSNGPAGKLIKSMSTSRVEESLKALKALGLVEVERAYGCAIDLYKPQSWNTEPLTVGHSTGRHTFTPSGALSALALADRCKGVWGWLAKPDEAINVPAYAAQDAYTKPARKLQKLKGAKPKKVSMTVGAFRAKHGEPGKDGELYTFKSPTGGRLKGSLVMIDLCLQSFEVAA